MLVIQLNHKFSSYLQDETTRDGPDALSNHIEHGTNDADFACGQHTHCHSRIEMTTAHMS